MNTEGAAALFSAMFLLAIVPGPSDALVVMRALSAGMRPAIVMIFGIILADIIMMVTALVGLHALARILNEYIIYFDLIAGGLLISWGCSSIKSRNSKLNNEPSSHSGSFMAGFMITLADPKALLFFFALFPAFLEVHTITSTEVFLISVIGALLVFSIKSTYAWLSIRGNRLFENPKQKTVLRSLAGSVLCGIGSYRILMAIIQNA